MAAPPEVGAFQFTVAEVEVTLDAVRPPDWPGRAKVPAIAAIAAYAIVPDEYKKQEMVAACRGTSNILPVEVTNPLPNTILDEDTFTIVHRNPLPILLIDGVSVRG